MVSGSSKTATLWKSEILAPVFGSMTRTRYPRAQGMSLQEQQQYYGHPAGAWDDRGAVGRRQGPPSTGFGLRLLRDSYSGSRHTLSRGMLTRVLGSKGATGILGSPRRSITKASSGTVRRVLPRCTPRGIVRCRLCGRMQRDKVLQTAWWARRPAVTLSVQGWLAGWLALGNQFRCFMQLTLLADLHSLLIRHRSNQKAVCT